MKKGTVLKLGAALGAVLVVLGLLGYVVAKTMIEDATRRGLALGLVELDKRGVHVEAPRFGTTSLALPRGVVLRGLGGRCRVSGNEALSSAGVAGDALFDVRVGTVGIRMLDWSARRFEVSAEDVEIVPLVAEGGAATTRPELATARVAVRSARLAFDADPHDLQASLRPVVTELLELLRSGSTTIPFDLEGDVAFPWQGQDRRLRLQVADRDGRRAIVVVQDDIRALASSFERELTEAEIALVADNPVRTPTMLKLKKDAERISREAHDLDPTVPQDAYRHVTWSYSLTRAFGAEVAEKVTDAHEVGSKTNTEADHRMDYNNNAVGRRYALAGRDPSELLDLVRNDPAVIREPV